MSVSYSLEEIIAKARRDGSVALHVDHEWARGPHAMPNPIGRNKRVDAAFVGVWCVDCGEWVFKPEDVHGPPPSNETTG